MVAVFPGQGFEAMLKLTKKADYGLIAMRHLAEHAGSSSAKDLADAYGIPQEALAKILQRLAKAGLLRSMHGPKLLRLKGVVRIAETPETPIVIHGVQHIFHPPVALPAWPDCWRVESRRTLRASPIPDRGPS